MEKISAEIEYNVGNDIYSKILSNSIFKFILYNKDLSINIYKVTLQKLAFYGLYFKYHKYIKEFDKDKKSILKILLKYRFINHVYIKNPLLSSYLGALPIYQTYQRYSEIFPCEIKI